MASLAGGCVVHMAAASAPPQDKDGVYEIIRDYKETAGFVDNGLPDWFVGPLSGGVFPVNVQFLEDVPFRKPALVRDWFHQTVFSKFVLRDTVGVYLSCIS